MKLVKVKKSYFACNECLSTNEVYSIILGEQRTITFRLCKECLDNLSDDIDNISSDKVEE